MPPYWTPGLSYLLQCWHTCHVKYSNMTKWSFLKLCISDFQISGLSENSRHRWKKNLWKLVALAQWKVSFFKCFYEYRIGWVDVVIVATRKSRQRPKCFCHWRGNFPLLYCLRLWSYPFSLPRTCSNRWAGIKGTFFQTCYTGCFFLLVRLKMTKCQTLRKSWHLEPFRRIVLCNLTLVHF